MNYRRNLTNLINNMKIKTKFICIYGIVVLIPVLIVGFYLTYSMKNMIMQNTIREGYSNTDRINDRLSQALSTMADVSDRLYVDTVLQGMVLNNYKNSWEVVDAYNNHPIFEDYLDYYKEIANIRFYEQNDTMLDNSRFIRLTEDIKNSDWYQIALKDNGKISWQYIYDDLGKQKYLSLVRLIKVNNQGNLGVLVINVDSVYLHSIIADEPFETQVTLGNGNVILASRSNIEGNNIKKSILNFNPGDTDNSIKSINYNGINSMVITKAFSTNEAIEKFQIYTIMPINNIVNRVNQSSILGFIIIGISLVISIVLILLFSKLFTKRIILLRKEMHKVVNGDLNLSNSIEGKDEIGELYEDLDIMIESIKQLIYEAYEEKLQKEQLSSRQKDVEFKMLASQINPHFLYNTLETIRMKAHCNGQTDIAKIVKMLGKIMRRNLEVSARLVSFQSEIELMNDYLEIQKFRFGDRISYDIDIIGNINDYLILPLLLQPLVENAFVHGLETKEGKGKISVIVETRPDYLEISVIDDGIGIEKEKLESLGKQLMDYNNDAIKSIGLCNVNQRIKLYYGEIYGINIESKYGEGSKVIIHLPLKWEVISNVKSINS
ncbi:MAG TPA: histidine kinase [Clostridiaceae bacterium]